MEYLEIVKENICHHTAGVQYYEYGTTNKHYNIQLHR